MAMVKSAKGQVWRRFDEEWQDGVAKAAFPTDQYAILIVGNVGKEEYVKVPWQKKLRVKPGSVVVIPVGQSYGGTQYYEIIDDVRKRNPQILIYDIVTEADLKEGPDGESFTGNTSLKEAEDIRNKIRALPFTNDDGEASVTAPTHKLIVRRTQDEKGEWLEDYEVRELNPETPSPPEDEPTKEPEKPVKPKKPAKASKKAAPKAGVKKPSNTKKTTKK